MCRPKNWKNPYGTNLDRTKRLWARWEELPEEQLLLDENWCIFEAGADAMLEALRGDALIETLSLKHWSGIMGWHNLDLSTKKEARE